MCGIAGLVNVNGDPVSPDLLERMTDALAHRGPDGAGLWMERNVGLGHRRLAILDLTHAGDQPMVSQDGRYILTFNGEIYNFRELRQELVAEGYVFSSNTDSEVVLNAFSCWGTDAIPKFNGMFAFAIWDRLSEALLLARDRYGIKPLYYSRQGQRFAFASECKAILTHPQFVTRLNKPALLEYLTFQNFLTNQTLSEGLSILPAGHWMTFSPRYPETFNSNAYWDFQFREPDRPASDEEYVEELDRLFSQAVRRQLVSDVEVGSYLSGGIDSGLITAIASRHLPGMKSFVCGFDLTSASGLELGFDEREQAEMLSAHFKTELYEMVLKAGDMERCLPRLAMHLEEPRVGQSYPNFYAAQLASRFVKVVLAGTGGDELFGGYPWRYLVGADRRPLSDFVDEYFTRWQRLLSTSELTALLRPTLGDLDPEYARQILYGIVSRQYDSITSGAEALNACMYFEAKTFLHGLLIVEDKLSMSHGLETRVPFLDNDLVDFAEQIPARLRVSLGQRYFAVDENLLGKSSRVGALNGPEGKLLLRRLASKYLPQPVASARKIGFSAPDESWFRGESLDFVQRRLYDANSTLAEIMDVDEMKRLVDEHLSGARNRRLLIWSLLSLSEYLEVY